MEEYYNQKEEKNLTDGINKDDNQPLLVKKMTIADSNEKRFKQVFGKDYQATTNHELKMAQDLYGSKAIV
jgi:hypothetical protein